MSIERTRQISEIGTVGPDSVSGVGLQAPSSALDRLYGANGSSGYEVSTPGGDGFTASNANASHHEMHSDFASNFAANFLGGASEGDQPGAPATGGGSEPTAEERASKPGAPATGGGYEPTAEERAAKPGAPRGTTRRRRSSRARRAGSAARARTGRSSRSGRARNAQRRGRTGRTGRTSRTQRTGRTRSSRGPSLNPARTGNPTADAAIAYNNRSFKAGQTKRCADFVSTMLRQSGTAPRGFRHQESVAGLARYGRTVPRDQLKPGDVVMFGNTYRPGRYTHTGIYAGNGMFVHRPTANAPVRTDSLNSDYWRRHYTESRRMSE